MCTAKTAHLCRATKRTYWRSGCEAAVKPYHSLFLFLNLKQMPWIHKINESVRETKTCSHLRDLICSRPQTDQMQNMSNSWSKWTLNLYLVSAFQQNIWRVWREGAKNDDGAEGTKIRWLEKRVQLPIKSSSSSVPNQTHIKVIAIK